MYFYVRVVHVVVVIKSERARTKVSTWTAWRHRWIGATTRACLITAVTMATTIPGWSGRRTLSAPSVACTSTILYSGLLALDALFLSRSCCCFFGSLSSSSSSLSCSCSCSCSSSSSSSSSNPFSSASSSSATAAFAVSQSTIFYSRRPR